MYWFIDLALACNTNGQMEILEAVPFRLTPNLQHFVTRTGIEGPFISTMLALSRVLSDPSLQFEDFLGIFLRDESISWVGLQRQPSQGALADSTMKERIAQNANVVMKKIQSLSTPREGEPESAPADQRLLELIAAATNPQQLCQMDPTWQPWF